jgi:hypothetical protein
VALIPLRKHLRVCVNHIKPLIIERKADLQRISSDSSYKWVEPQDCIQWFLDEAEREIKPTDAEDDLIAQKIMFLNLASIHTSFVTATNAILDIFSATDSDDIVHGLREEHNRLLTESNGVWTKDGLNKMKRTDSAIRESLRVNPMNIRGLERLVSKWTFRTKYCSHTSANQASTGQTKRRVHFQEWYSRCSKLPYLSSSMGYSS